MSEFYQFIKLCSRLEIVMSKKPTLCFLVVLLVTALAFGIFPQNSVAESGIPGIESPREESEYYKRKQQRQQRPQNLSASEKVDKNMGNQGQAGQARADKIKRMKALCIWQMEQGQPLAKACNYFSEFKPEAEPKSGRYRRRSNSEANDDFGNDRMEQMLLRGGGKNLWDDDMFLSPEEKQRRDAKKRKLEKEKDEEQAYKRQMRNLSIQEKKAKIEMAEQNKKFREEDMEMRKEEMERRRIEEDETKAYKTMENFNRSLDSALGFQERLNRMSRPQPQY